MARIIKEILTTLAHKDSRVDLAVQQATGLPRSVIRGMFDHSCISLDGELCHDGGFKLSVGMKLAVHYDPKMRYREKPKASRSRLFDLVFEDEHLIVVNKQAGCLTVPTHARETNTLVHAVKSHVNRGQARGRPVAIVHRLDRDTSGLLVFAKTESIGHQIKNQFADRKPERVYIAIVAGQLTQPSGTIRSYLATDKDLNQRSVLNAIEGKLAITHYTVLQTFKDATVVRVTLETGRRNQIRVHFAELGHPILGDIRYDAGNARHRYWPHHRLALHAEVLGFKHPVSSKSLHFTAPQPHEFEKFFSLALRP